VLGQTLHLLVPPVTGQRFERLDNLRMQRPPLLREQTAIGHLVGQRVLEGVRTLWEEAGLVQELGHLELQEAVVHSRLGQRSDGLQQQHGHLHANDGCHVQQVLHGGWQAINPRRQYRLHRHRHLDSGQGLGKVRRWMSGARVGCSPRRSCSSASALAGGSESSRSCV
jgi:hypothetical protein